MRGHSRPGVDVCSHAMQPIRHDARAQTSTRCDNPSRPSVGPCMHFAHQASPLRAVVCHPQQPTNTVLPHLASWPAPSTPSLTDHRPTSSPLRRQPSYAAPFIRFRRARDRCTVIERSHWSCLQQLSRDTNLTPPLPCASTLVLASPRVQTPRANITSVSASSASTRTTATRRRPALTTCSRRARRSSKDGVSRPSLASTSRVLTRRRRPFQHRPRSGIRRPYRTTQPVRRDDRNVCLRNRSHPQPRSPHQLTTRSPFPQTRRLSLPNRTKSLSCSP